MYDWNKVPRQDLVKSWEIFQYDTSVQINDLKVYYKVMSNEAVRKKISLHESWDDTFSHFFRVTFLIQTYTVLEYNLKKICLSVERFNFQKFSIQDLSGSSDLYKAKIYLKKTIDFNIGELPEWNIITDCQVLRNCIVHENCFF